MWKDRVVTRRQKNAGGVRGKGARAKGWDRSSWVSLAPNGIGYQKPNHFGEMVKTVVENRRELPFAWRILHQGTCDGCALGTAGIRDWTLPDGPVSGVHLCTVRLNLLKLNTMGAIPPGVLSDVRGVDHLSGAELRDLGRLDHPMRRGAGEPGFTRISWDEALSGIAGSLRRFGPDRSYLYMTSRGITNEVYYAAQKAWRSFGSPHVDNAARICHSPSTAALKDTVGVAATTCSYRDILESDLVIFFGSDVANNQPVMMKYLYLAKRHNGTRIAVVNPFREPGMERYWVPSNAESALFGTRFTDDFFPVTTGGDIAFIQGVLKVLIERGAVDREWIDARTTGFDALESHLAKTSWDDIARRSGLTRRECERFADLYAGARRTVLVWSMGITQHTHGTDNVRAIVNLALARGNIGRDGCGIMPIRGHSGVQGGAEMGAYATALPGGVGLTPENLSRIGDEYGFTLPGGPGKSATEMVSACEAGQAGVLYASGSNLLDVLPDPQRVRAALHAVPVRVHQDIVVTSQMLVPAAETVYLLPAATRYEQEGGGTETSTERRVIFSPEIRGRRIGSARSEWKIFSDLAACLHGDRRASFDSAQAIREEIARIVPAYAGIENLRTTGDAFQWGGRHLCVDSFPTPDGRARFSVVEPPGDDIPPGKFRLSTRRGKQFNSLVHRNRDPLTGAARDAVFMAADDVLALGLTDGAPVNVRSDVGTFAGKIRVSHIAARNVAVHWPEGNVLIAQGAVDSGGGVPDYNAVVEIEPRLFESR